MTGAVDRFPASCPSPLRDGSVARAPALHLSLLDLNTLAPVAGVVATETSASFAGSVPIRIPRDALAVGEVAAPIEGTRE